MKISKHNILSWLLEDRYHDGLGGPPNNHRVSPHFPSSQSGMSAGHEYFCLLFNNDASEVWISTKYTDEPKSRYVLSISARDFRQLALWYLWRWAWGEWFGLRRVLFYRRLTKQVAKMQGKQ